MASMVDLSSWIWKAWGGRAESELELELASRRPLSGILREFISTVEVVFANVERRCRFPAAEEPQDIERMDAEQADQALLSKRMGRRCCRELSLGGRLLAAEEIAWVKSDSTGQNKHYKRQCGRRMID